MKKSFKTSLILSMILCASLLSFTSTSTRTVNAYSTTFAVGQVTWGTDTGEVYPGDQNVPLTVVVQNVGTGTYQYPATPANPTINGIRANLWLPAPSFTDVGGATYSSAYYSSTTGVSSGGSFSLTFRLNINATASPGTYLLGMNLKYLVQTAAGPPATWIEGDDRSLTVVVSLMGKCTLAVTTTGNSLTAGSSNTLNINIVNKGNSTAPVLDVSLTLPAPLVLSGDNYWHFTSLGPNASVNIKTQVYVPPTASVGTTYQATLSLAYQTPYGNVRTETHSIGLVVLGVVYPTLVVSIIGDQLAAGSMNPLIFTVKNNGSLPVTVLDASLTLPSPLVLSGDSRWHFTGISPNTSVKIKTDVYVPPLISIGTTYQATFSLTYQTSYGDVRTEIRSIGLRVSESTQPLRLTVSINGSELTAGSMNSLYFTVKNNGSTPITVLDLYLNLPQPLALSGDNNWHFTGISPSASVNIKADFYVPIVSAGTTYQATFSLTYQTSYGDVRTEAHSIGLIVLKVIYPTLTVSVSGGELTAGAMNNLYFTIKNNGSMPVTVLDVSFTMPSPLVLSGDSRWHFTDISPSAAVKIGVSTYAPNAAAGTTYQATLSLTYQTSYGNVRTDTYPIGLIVLGVVYPPLTVSISGSELTGGYANNVSLAITNVGSTPISTLDIVLTWQGAAAATTTPPLLLMGDNKWRFTDIPAKGTVSINLKIFSTTSSIGGAYQGNLALTCQDRYGNSKTDSHSIGFYVKGIVQIVVYGASTNPAVAVVGSSVTVTANLLNKGNIAAMYTNVSVAREAPWSTGSDSIAYIGQVDPNSPAPFTVIVRVTTAAQNGTYPLTLLVSSQDERYVAYFFKYTLQIRVTTKAATAQQRPTPTPLETFWASWRYYIFAAVFVTIALVLYYVWRRRKRSRAPKV